MDALTLSYKPGTVISTWYCVIDCLLVFLLGLRPYRGHLTVRPSVMLHCIVAAWVCFLRCVKGTSKEYDLLIQRYWCRSVSIQSASFDARLVSGLFFAMGWGSKEHLIEKLAIKGACTNFFSLALSIQEVFIACGISFGRLGLRFVWLGFVESQVLGTSSKFVVETCF